MIHEYRTRAIPINPVTRAPAMVLGTVGDSTSAVAAGSRH